jgi:hypothetical protein
VQLLTLNRVAIHVNSDPFTTNRGTGMGTLEVVAADLHHRWLRPWGCPEAVRVTEQPFSETHC